MTSYKTTRKGNYTRTTTNNNSGTTTTISSGERGSPVRHSITTNRNGSIVETTRYRSPDGFVRTKRKTVRPAHKALNKVSKPVKAKITKIPRPKTTSQPRFRAPKYLRYSKIKANKKIRLGRISFSKAYRLLKIITIFTLFIILLPPVLNTINILIK